MDAVSLAFSALAIVSILAIAGLLALFEKRFVPADWGRTVLVAGVGGVIVALACSLQLLVLPFLVSGPLVALGALFATLATSQLKLDSTARRLILAAISTTVIFVPLAAAVFGTVFGAVFDLFGTQLGVIDQGGAVPTLIGGGAIALGVGLFNGRPAVDARESVAGVSPLVPAILAWIAGVGWLVGIELAFDDMVPIIVVNALIMPLVAAIAASVIERIRFRCNTVPGSVTGLVAGMAAAVSSCALVTPPLAVVIALTVGAVGALLPARLRAWPAATLAVGASISVVLLGAFATDIGAIYTGQPEVVLGQLAIAVIAAVGGLAVGAATGWAFRRWPSTQRYSVPIRTVSKRH